MKLPSGIQAIMNAPGAQQDKDGAAWHRLFLCLGTVIALSACAPPAASLSPAPQAIEAAWVARGDGAGETFGIRAMAAGDLNGDGYDDLVVGAPGWQRHHGRAVVYYGSAHGLPAKPSWIATGHDFNDNFGDRVGQAGDVNGDGFDDLFVASPGHGKGLGQVLVYLGSKQGLRAEPDWSVSPDSPNTFFGDCTHPTGDLNGDGYDDLAVGAYGFDQGRGRIQLFLGGPQGLSRKPVWQSLGDDQRDWYGYGIGAAGDINGDGIDDLQAGAKYNDQGGHDAGKAYLYLGRREGLPVKPDWTWLGPGPDANATVRITTAGDVNGDGYADLLITAPGSRGDNRKAYLFLGSAKGLASVPDQIIEAPKDAEFFGEGAAPVGDLDGDGYDDVALHMRAMGGYGEALIYRGGPQGLQATPSWVLRGEQGGDRYAWWLSPAGDVDGDGRPDFAVSAETHENGAVYLYLGRQFPQALHREGKAKSLRGYLVRRQRSEKASIH